MAKQFKTGDRVAWQSSGGGSVGRVERKLTSPGKIKGHEVAASRRQSRISGPVGEVGQDRRSQAFGVEEGQMNPGSSRQRMSRPPRKKALSCARNFTGAELRLASIAQRSSRSVETYRLRDIIAISAYFARHEVDKASKSHEWGDETDPSAGYIAWLLWGGEPGRRWADSLKARLNKTAAE